MRAALLVLASFLGAVPLAAAPKPARPQVLKVEPPSWFVGHSLNPVRLLVRGRGLHGARAEAVGSGIATGLVRVNDAGTYAFVDVHVDPTAAPGARRVRLTTPAGAAEAAFELLAPLPRTGRFQGFSPDDVIYLVMPDRFANGDAANDEPTASPGLLDRGRPRYYHGGDIRGIADRLPYLKDLGVTVLWLNPWYDNVNHPNEIQKVDGQPTADYHGYHAHDFYAVEERFGDLAALRAFVDAAHALGIKVIQDQVANHAGPYHPWIADPPTPTWLNGTGGTHLANTWQTWTLMDPHAVPAVRRSTLEGWFVDVLPDLNQDDDEVSRYVIQNTLWWVGVLGLDGIRQDTLPYVPRHFWRDWTAAIRREHPGLSVVGEMWDGDPALVAFFQGGAARDDGIDSGIDALFDFPLLYPIRRAFAEGKPLREVAVMLAHDHLYPAPSRLVTFLGNHDVSRFMSEPGASVAGLKLAFSFQMTTRGIPLIYYGDEIGLAGGGDPDNRRDFPGGWPGDPRNAFEAAGRTPDEQSVFEHVRRLARLRASLAPLRRGRLVNLAVEEQAWAYARQMDGQPAVVVVLNNAATAATLEFEPPDGLGDGSVLEDGLGGAPVTVAGGRIRATLPARAAAVYVPKR